MPLGETTSPALASAVQPAAGQPWTALAVASLGLNFVWEMLQAPLFEDMLTMPRWTATWLCARASIGDAVITLVAYGSVALLARSRTWIVVPRVGQVAGYLVVGLAATVALEFLNVYVLGRWSYAPRMPLVWGVGLAPIAQWLIVPLLVLWVARRYLCRAAALRSGSKEISP